MNPEPNNQEVVLSLEELNLTPGWVKAPVKNYDRHPGESGARQPAQGPRPHRDRSYAPRGDRPTEPRRERSRRPATDRPAAPPTAPPPPLPNIEVTFVPNEVQFASMIDTIKQSSRAYALFDLAKLVLNKPERHNVKLAYPDGALHCALLAGGVFLSQEEALRHSLRQGDGKLFTRTDKPVDPPKGNFQFVSRCGLTGEWLGPPNYHEYQARLVKHHQQRLAHIPFERFKARIETVHDPVAVQAWVESKSKRTEYTSLLDPEPKVFADRDELEKHIRANHLDKLVAAVPRVELTGPMSRHVPDSRLVAVIREAWENERRFPLKTANEIRPLLVKAGLQFFKHKKGITYISRIKPHRFESLAQLTAPVQKIIAFLRTHEGATRKQLAKHLAPVDETALASDLHWLIQDGYVVEFYDGKLWAVEDKPAKPVPAPAPTTAPTPAPEPAETTVATAPLPTESESAPAPSPPTAPTPAPAPEPGATPVAATPPPTESEPAPPPVA